MEKALPILAGIVIVGFLILFLTRNINKNHKSVATSRTLLYRFVTIAIVVALIICLFATLGEGCNGLLNEDSDYKMR